MKRKLIIVVVTPLIILTALFLLYSLALIFGLSSKELPGSRKYGWTISKTSASPPTTVVSTNGIAIELNPYESVSIHPTDDKLYIDNSLKEARYIYLMPIKSFDDEDKLKEMVRTYQRVILDKGERETYDLKKRQMKEYGEVVTLHLPTAPDEYLKAYLISINKNLVVIYTFDTKNFEKLNFLNRIKEVDDI